MLQANYILFYGDNCALTCYFNNAVNLSLFFLTYFLFVLSGVLIVHDLLLSGKAPTTKKEYPEFDIKLHLVVRLSFWKFGVFQVLLHCHYSQALSDPECQ